MQDSLQVDAELPGVAMQVGQLVTGQLVNGLAVRLEGGQPREVVEAQLMALHEVDQGPEGLFGIFQVK